MSIHRDVCKDVLDLFNVAVIDTKKRANSYMLNYAARGFVIDFIPSSDQIAVFTERFKPLDMLTLFSREERDNINSESLLTKQILHYIEVYGLDTPGLFNLEVNNGKVVTFSFIEGVTLVELTYKVHELLYLNAPVKNSVALERIINYYGIDFDINKVVNNELRITLYDANKHVFNNGDDATRWICYTCTGSPMLIKSRDVIQQVKANSHNIPWMFFHSHKNVLVQVFNRHKSIILACKNSVNKGVVNKISRMSKVKHIPIRESINKTFLSKALNDRSFDMDFCLSQIAVRDKLKFLNILAYKQEKLSTDAFIIRNGKLFVKDGRKVYLARDTDRVQEAVLKSLERDLEHLKDEEILLDPNLNYGLPVSRKQTIGQLPFGTTVKVNGQISSGMYWENNWGARDLDLSTIDLEGKRTGWGQYSGYDKSNNVIFSGDVVSAPDGAMEFMTSKKETYGLFVNIFNGRIGAEMELIVGENVSKGQWIDTPIIRERLKLESKSTIIGFVRDNEFVVYNGRLNNGRWSNAANKSFVTRGISGFWTVNTLFDCIGVGYALDKDSDVDYVHNLSYEEFSYDKLESLLLK